MTTVRDFNKQASNWDNNPRRVALAQAVVEAILDTIQPNGSERVLDFGCGTGLVSLGLSSRVASVTGVDTSSGMIEVLQGKITTTELTNLTTRVIGSDRAENLGGPYDLICSSMTFHHVENIQPLLGQLFTHLRSGGRIAVADLDLEDGTFHPDNTGVFHFGFDRQTLKSLFEEAGFADVSDMTATTFEKPDKNGQSRPFSVFLMTARKP